MDQIIQAVAQKANITQEQARTAVEMVVNLLKSKLPQQMSGQIDGILNGSAGGDLAKDVENIAGGLFNKK